MSETEPAENGDALLTRLTVIEDQPLAARAEAFGQVYDELRRRLDAGDSARSDG